MAKPSSVLSSSQALKTHTRNRRVKHRYPTLAKPGWGTLPVHEMDSVALTGLSLFSGAFPGWTHRSTPPDQKPVRGGPVLRRAPSWANIGRSPRELKKREDGGRTSQHDLALAMRTLSR